MHYSPTYTGDFEKPRALPQSVRYVAIAVLAAAAGYGLGSHHVVIVALGILAVLALQLRIGDIASVASSTRMAAHADADGGSFPGEVIDRKIRAADKPAPLDGGCCRAPRSASSVQG